jgi:magnesium transporter
MRKRVPWLVILLFLGLCVSAIVSLFEGVIDELPMIVAFQSLILGMAGNVGTQSLAITVRSLGSGNDPSFKERFMIIMKETQVAFLNGLALGLFSFLIVGIYLLLLGGLAPTVALVSAVCVGAALWFAMTISGFTGAAIPICFYRMGIDPAVASGPLITTVNDLVAVVSYYGLAWALLVNLV